MKTLDDQTSRPVPCHRPRLEYDWLESLRSAAVAKGIPESENVWARALQNVEMRHAAWSDRA